MTEKSKNTLSFAITAVIIIALIIYLAFSIIDARREAEEERIEALRQQKEIEKIVFPIAKRYGIDDLVFESAEVSGSFELDCCFSSKSLEEKSYEQILGMMADILLYTEETDGVNWGSYGPDYEIDDIILICNGNKYTETWEDETSILKKNGGVVFEMVTSYAQKHNAEYEHFINSGSSSKKCYMCNGTGMVKYYYGGSALEAALDGYNNYEYGQCGSCGGTGKAK